jgi:WD40-like Beta Propeller Repeat
MRKLIGLLAKTGLCMAATAVLGNATAYGGSPEAGARNGAIVFMRPGEIGDYDLWVVRPDGSGLRQLTSAPINRSDYNPDWSPDGSTVIFERRVLDDSGLADNLYTVRADGTGLHPITDCADDCWANNEATWSRNGQHIAFDRAIGPRAGGHPVTAAIYVMNADGTDDREPSAPGPNEEDHYPTWSPDGRRSCSCGTPMPTPRFDGADSRRRPHRIRAGRIFVPVVGAGRRHPEILGQRPAHPVHLLVQHLRRRMPTEHTHPAQLPARHHPPERHRLAQSCRSRYSPTAGHGRPTTATSRSAASPTPTPTGSAPRAWTEASSRRSRGGRCSPPIRIGAGPHTRRPDSHAETTASANAT